MGIFLPFPGPPPFSIWHVWPPPPELVRTCPLTATLFSGVATEHTGLWLTCEVHFLPPTLNTFLPGMLP